MFDLCRPSPRVSSPCECESTQPDSLDAGLFSFVVLVLAPAVTVDKVTSLIVHGGVGGFGRVEQIRLICVYKCGTWRKNEGWGVGGGDLFDVGVVMCDM